MYRAVLAGRPPPSHGKPLLHSGYCQRGLTPGSEDRPVGRDDRIDGVRMAGEISMEFRIASRFAIAVTAAIGLASAPSILGQSQADTKDNAPLAFDVTSVKPSQPGSRGFRYPTNVERAGVQSWWGSGPANDRADVQDY